MLDSQVIKERLKAIQSYFNPQKNTYKVIEYVVNNKLTYKQMLAELSKIKGFDKYPEELKKEYVSIIKEIKKNIVKQMKDEEREKQEANTRELKDIIANLEKSKKEFMEKEKEVKNEKPVVEKEPEVPKAEEKEQDEKEISSEVPVVETDAEKIAKIKKVLTLGIFIVVVLMVLVLFLY